MSIKSDKWIRRMAEQHGMIEPFEPGQVREADGRKIVSYGTSSYGYDIRCAPEFKVFTNIHSTVVDPKNFDEKSFVDIQGDVCIIPPNSFALARTVEYFRIPRNVHHLPGQEHLCALRHHRQRDALRARVGRLCDAGVLHAAAGQDLRGEGCAQVLFFESDEVCETSYKDRGGKYQGQVGVTLPKT
jgi:dCTP deaminase